MKGMILVDCVIKIRYKVFYINKYGYDSEIVNSHSRFITQSNLDNEYLFTCGATTMESMKPLVVGHTLEEVHDFIDNELKRIIFINSINADIRNSESMIYKINGIYIYEKIKEDIYRLIDKNHDFDGLSILNDFIFVDS